MVGTASSCPRFTVEKGEKNKAQREIFAGKPRNQRVHKKRAQPTLLEGIGVVKKLIIDFY